MSQGSDSESQADPAVISTGTVEPETSTGSTEFNFDAHSREATERFQPLQPEYHDFSRVLGEILSATLADAGIRFHTLEWRGKTVPSFQRKASQASENDPTRPKYADPVAEITDLAGARIITFFLNDVEAIRPRISAEFEVLEEIDKSQELEDEGTFVGYRSIHCIVRLQPGRTRLPEYARFRGLIGEIQVRTIMQHAWAEIEHDIQYKSVATLPGAIRSRFAQLAGQLAIADREFQAIQEEDERLRAAARISVEEGRLDEVEITPDALKAYLDKKLGPDGRMKDWTYRWTASLLSKLGFVNFEELDRVLEDLDDDFLSRRIWGGRQGQLTRFEDMLMAAMGDNYLTAAPNSEWRRPYFERAGIELGNKSVSTSKGQR
jgi:putative GTP pyrophosphokinase